ncbi:MULTISPECIES: 2OG-Fe(II) oxygenase [unclassified Shewanella]|uniref:2OG-Fe(II) oxygenase n=1 Tax=unclassified Shewanella TaxID=196818 RepID=UPI000C83182D|nr:MULTISPECIES: 2OG-Fe(II) oxygenase [unclassified Shewanella]MDO6680407.1 2OG-Fe(II) oxygenase [Shewanella sp. 4_MG-2023]PMG42575.1 proline hydroxylase [Shewanella sp. 10N.286.52.B9]
MDFIDVIPNAISDDLCDRLRNAFDNHSGVTEGKTGQGVDRNKKRSLDLTLDLHNNLTQLKNELLQLTLTHAANYFSQYPMALMGAVSVTIANDKGEAVTLNPDNFSDLGANKAKAITQYLYRSGTVNVQKYQQSLGGYPHWHSEHFPQSGSHEALHRVLLYMYYLNDVEQGGETEFYYQNKVIKPTKGTMVIAPAGFTHTHRGNIPISDDKYIATSWIMFNRAEQLYTAQAK